MANRRYINQQFSLTPMLTSIYAQVSFGASGAPTLNIPFSKGVVSVTRNSTGNYTFVFGTTSGSLDSYNHLLDARVSLDTAATSAAPAAPAMYISNNSVATSASCSLTVQFNSAGTATDPASGEIARFSFQFKNSSAP